MGTVWHELQPDELTHKINKSKTLACAYIEQSTICNVNGLNLNALISNRPVYWYTFMSLIPVFVNKL